MGDHGLYTNVEETLNAFGQCICVNCMDIHALSRYCHHPNGLLRFTSGVDGMSGHIIDISKPTSIGHETVLHEGMALDAVLLDYVFKAPITTVKSISHSCRMAFSQALQSALNKVVAHPESVESWVRLLLLPRCTL